MAQARNDSLLMSADASWTAEASPADCCALAHRTQLAQEMRTRHFAVDDDLSVGPVRQRRRGGTALGEVLVLVDTVVAGIAAREECLAVVARLPRRRALALAT
jgi:hypothetical protein